MAVWSEVNLSRLEYSRIDGDFYNPKYLHYDQKLDRFGDEHSLVKLKEAISVPVRTGRTPSNRLVKKQDTSIHFIKTDTLREGRIDFKSCDYLPQRVVNNHDYIPPQSVLLTIIGATPEIVGRAAIIRKIDPISVTNQNVAIVSTNCKLNPFFLTSYLLTNYGRNQVWRHSRRTAQVNLNCREVERILVPLPEMHIQEIIGKSVEKSFALIDESQSLYTQAQQIFKAEIGLDKLDFVKPMGYVASFSEVINNNRADSDYYQPKYREIHKCIYDYRNGWEPLLFLAEAIRPNINPKNEPEQEHEYIELSGINPTLGVIEQTKTITGRNAPTRARRLVSSGDVIASAVIGSVDKAALVDDNYDKCLASTGFFHFQPRTVTSEYFLILVRSLIVTMQLQQEATGGILSAVPDVRVKNVIVPIIPDQLIDEISSLVSKSHQKFRESEKLLEITKRRVEELIEEAVQQ